MLSTDEETPTPSPRPLKQYQQSREEAMLHTTYQQQQSREEPVLHSSYQQQPQQTKEKAVLPTQQLVENDNWIYRDPQGDVQGE